MINTKDLCRPNCQKMQGRERSSHLVPYSRMVRMSEIPHQPTGKAPLQPCTAVTHGGNLESEKVQTREIASRVSFSAKKENFSRNR